MKRLIKASNTHITLYHVTPSKYIDTILSDGLIPEVGDYIYLSEKPITQYDGDVLLKVTVPNNNLLYDWEDFWLDEAGNEIDYDHQYDPNNKYYMYEGKIGPQYIERL